MPKSPEGNNWGTEARFTRALQNALLGALRLARRLGLTSGGAGRAISLVSYRLYKDLVEGATARRLCQFAVPGTAVLDVGANVGFYALRFAAHVGATGKVIAFEPEPENFGQLCRAIARTRHGVQIDAVRAAAAEYTGSAWLALNPNNPADHRLATAGIPVKTVRIDDEIGAREWPAVSLIKIDVQGAEPRVVAGAEETLRRFRPALFLEVDIATSDDGGRGIGELLQFLYRRGYRGYVLTRHLVGPLSPEAMLDLAQRRGYMDFLLVNSENAESEAILQALERD